MKKAGLLLISIISVFFSSCEDEARNARIEVWLTDDEGNYQEVNVDLQAVEVHASDAVSENGWQAVEVTPKVYNLLDYANGEETLLGNLELPAGKLSQIRLKLGDENTVKVDDQTYDLATPSGQQSGLKIRLNEVLGEGITYKITLDFEAGKSVIKTGNGKYILKPSIRAITEASGSIQGSVNPPGVVAISLMAADTVYSTTSSNEEGKFLISGIRTAGTYKLVFDAPGDTPDVEKADVDVQIGTVTDVGVIELTQ